VKKILVVQTAFLGDVILATPLAETLKMSHPEVQIHFLVKKENASLLNNHQFINRVWTFDKSIGKIKALKFLIPKLREEKFDIVINLHRFLSSGIISKMCGAEMIIGFKKNPLSFLFTESYPHEIGNGKHEVDRNLSLLKTLNIKKEYRKPKLFHSQKDEEFISQFANTSFFCLAPASVWYTKQMPEEKWVELADKVGRFGNVYLLGGPNDSELCERIRVQSKSVVVNLAGKLTILQSMALMAKALRSYVNDSGPLHLASACNAPVTAFFCSTTPEFGFGPLSDDAEVIETKEELDCKPCGLHGHKACPKGHFKCGINISLP
jgi:lipopolysaccharide heptosyltransferase II